MGQLGVRRANESSSKMVLREIGDELKRLSRTAKAISRADLNSDVRQTKRGKKRLTEADSVMTLVVLAERQVSGRR